MISAQAARPALTRRTIAVAGHVGDVVAVRSGLDDENPAVRATALAALARLDALDAHTLMSATTDASSVVRRRAAQLAAVHPGFDLRGLLADADPMVAEMAAWACGEHVDVDRATRMVLGELARTHDEPLVRESAVAALGAIGEPDTVGLILAALTDKPAIRRRAVIALANFEGAEIDAALHAALADRDWQVRQAAEELLKIATHPEPNAEPDVDVDP